MQRYLIHHDEGGTWDLVVIGDAWTVERVRTGLRLSLPLKNFEASPDGRRLAEQLAQALVRAVTS